MDFIKSSLSGIYLAQRHRRAPGKTSRSFWIDQTTKPDDDLDIK